MTSPPSTKARGRNPLSSFVEEDPQSPRDLCLSNLTQMRMSTCVLEAGRTLSVIVQDEAQAEASSAPPDLRTAVRERLLSLPVLLAVFSVAFITVSCFAAWYLTYDMTLQTIASLTEDLETQIVPLVAQSTQGHLQTAEQQVRLNQRAFSLGVFGADKASFLPHFFLQLNHTHASSSVFFISRTGGLYGAFADEDGISTSLWDFDESTMNQTVWLADSLTGRPEQLLRVAVI
eukprot:RCo019738